MAWIKVDETLPDNRKVLAVAGLLRIDQDTVVGKLVRLWGWILSNREDGRFEKQDGRRIAEVMRFRGRPERLLGALLTAGLIEEDGEGFRIHDWEQYAGALITQRVQTRERVKRFREKDAVTVTETVTETLQTGACNALRNDDRVRVESKEKINDDDDGCRRARLREHWVRSWGREPTAAELDASVRWSCMGSSEELIAEAVRRAAQTNARNPFGYAGHCLARWEAQGITNMAELTEADFEHEKEHSAG